MYKVPFKLVAILNPNPANDPTEFGQYLETANVLDAIEHYGREQYSVGSLLTVRWGNRIFITTYYVNVSKSNAQFEAAHYGFPFIADENDRTIKVGLLARLYRAIIR